MPTTQTEAILPGGETDYAVPPGVTLRETMESLALGHEEMAKFLGLSERELHSLLSGKAPLSVQTAKKLGSLFGTGADFWITLERNFVADKVRLEICTNKGVDTAEPGF